MESIETLPLPNGLILTIRDLSKRIAQDTVKVELSFQMKVKVLESFFSSREDYLQLTGIFGDELTYERKMERSFVSDPEESSVRADLMETFKNNSLPYLSSPNFAQKMALSLLKDIQKNPFKYRTPPPLDSDEE
ncbi:MAG: hypothetical protein KBA28_10955 [Syntrophaceae bacterium]|mgnify:FL=1|jgi:hypothetical protein|nr:hypothetical protein [Syntrophaceae bacterium]